MKDEYLWNKTGDDPELRQLEESLVVFRYEPGPAPVTVARDVPAAGPWWSMAWLKISLASAAAAAVAAGIWFVGMQRPELAKTTVTTQDPVAHAAPLPEPEIASRPEAGKVSGPAAAEPDRVSADDRPRPVRARAEVARRPAGLKAGRPAVKRERTLTSEEEYAYKRLMLALSIAGEKLRIVRNTIDGTDEPGAGGHRR